MKTSRITYSILTLFKLTAATSFALFVAINVPSKILIAVVLIGIVAAIAIGILQMYSKRVFEKQMLLNLILGPFIGAAAGAVASITSIVLILLCLGFVLSWGDSVDFFATRGVTIIKFASGFGAGIGLLFPGSQEWLIRTIGAFNLFH